MKKHSECIFKYKAWNMNAHGEKIVLTVRVLFKSLSQMDGFPSVLLNNLRHAHYPTGHQPPPPQTTLKAG